MNNNLELKEKIIYTESTTLFLFNLILNYLEFLKQLSNNFTSTVVLLISILIIGMSCYLICISYRKDISYS